MKFNIKLNKKKQNSKVRKGAQIFDFGSREDKKLVKLSYTPADIEAYRRNGML